jgi:hypothetical protein
VRRFAKRKRHQRRTFENDGLYQSEKRPRRQKSGHGKSRPASDFEQTQRSINSASNDDEAIKFFQTNLLNVSQVNLIKKLFREARENNFEIKIEKGEVAQR